MANGIELARAFVTLIPSFEGAQSKITEQLLPPAEVASAGDKAGASMASRFGGSFKKALGPLFGAGALVGAFKGLYSLGETFDNMADTIRVGTGATGKALDAMVESAKNVGKTVPTSFESASQSIADWNTRMGLSGEALEKVAAQSEMLKSLGMESDINALSAAFNAFSISGDATVGAMDTLFRVSQATGVNMDTLAGTVQRSAPALQSLGFSFEEAASMAGLLDKAGLNSQQVMASMSKGLVTLAKNGESPQKAFKRVTQEIKGFLDKGNEAAAIDLAGKVFGTRGATQMIQALKDSKLSFDDLVNSAGMTEDTIMSVGAETQDFSEKWILLKNNAAAALEPLGSAVFGALSDALSGLLPHIQTFGAWLGEHQGVIVAFAAVVGTVLVGGFLSWAASIVAVNVALLANPITWIVAGVAALAAGIVALWNNWDSVASWLSDTWSSVVDTVGTAFSSLGNWFSETGASIVDGISSTWNSATSATSSAWESVKSATSGAWDWVKSTTSGAWEATTSTVSSGVEKAAAFMSSLPGKSATALSSLGSTITGIASSAWEMFKGAVSSGITTVVDLVRSLPGRARDALGNLGNFLYESGASLIRGFKNGIMGAFTAVKDAVKGGLSKIRNLFPFSPAKEGPFSGKGWVLYSGLSVGNAFAEGISVSSKNAQKAALGMATAARDALGTALDSTMQFSPARVAFAGENGADGFQRGTVINVGTIYNPLPEASSTSLARELQAAAAGVGSLV